MIRLLILLFYIYFWGCVSIATSAKVRDLFINKAIKAPQVRVIGDSGEQLGVMKTEDALDIALKLELDLVEIAPTAEIPVCRIMDYGKYKFEKSKKDKESKRRQKQIVIETKEIELSSRIAAHDFNTRLNHTRKFIEAGNKVKVTLEFGVGREMAHMELGYQTLERFEQACLDFCVVEKRPVREGRRVFMFLAPKKAAPAKIEKTETKSGDAETPPVGE